MNASFLETPREVTFDWHVVHAAKWLEFDGVRELGSVLVYAAVELRAAIERYVFELLYLLKEGKFSADEGERIGERIGTLLTRWTKWIRERTNRVRNASHA